MKDKRMVKESSKKEVVKKYVELIIHQILLEITSSSNVKEDLTSLFQYVGSYSKLISLKNYQKLKYINRKTKKNATKP